MHIRSVIAAVTALGLGLGVMSYAGAATDDDPTVTAPVEGAAPQALADAQLLFDGDPATNPLDGRDATLVLRDLLINRDQLRGSDRQAADKLLTRPSAQKKKCKKYTCVHWINSGGHRVPQTDTSPDNGIPDYVDKVLATMEHVHRTYVRAGYRAPLPDSGKGGNKKRDIYLRQIGDQGLYGYCTTDQKPRNPPLAVSSYCVLDNDYNTGEFPTNTPIENMRVTAAHEYFHAVQFAYDFLDDGWFMEGTATWAEDELYDSVNDNANYFPYGQLGSKASSGAGYAGPRRALDGFFGLNVYASWSFFRYLTERMPQSKGGMPVLVRDMWRLADARPGKPDQYGLQTIKSVLARKNRSFATTYAGFAEANRRTHTTYDEGVEVNYPNAPLWKSFTLTDTDRSSGRQAVRLDHLTSATASFRPGAGLTESGWKLKVKADMAPESKGSRLVVTLFPASGPVKVTHVNLNGKGVGKKSVAFRAGDVDHVEVTLVNASTRYKCHVARRGYGTYACDGRPKDENLVEKVTATAFR